MKNLVLKDFDLKTCVFIAEINLQPLFEKMETLEREFIVKKPPKYPSTFRDVTCIIKKEIKIKEILDFVKTLSIPYLEAVDCIKIYEGSPIPEGEKSITIRFWYRAEDRTLKDKEVNEIQDSVAKKIFERFSAKPR